MKNRKAKKGLAFFLAWMCLFLLYGRNTGIVYAEEEAKTLSSSNLEVPEAEEDIMVQASTDGWLRWLGKNVVKYIEEVEGISGIPEGITYPGEEAAVFPRDKKITILYKIDVEGTEGKSYTLIEEGAFWVAGGVAHQIVDGKLYVAGVGPESKKDFVYVARTFYNTDIIGGRLKSSVLIVPGCNGMKNTTAVRTLPVVDPPITDAGAVDEDLTFQKTALLDGTEVDKVVIGTVYQYRVTVTNHLSVPVKELEVYERLNQNYVSFLDAEPTGQYDVQRGVWTIETLGAKETATLTLTVRADRTTTLNQPYKNTINAWADNYEVPMGAEDKAQAEVRIVAAESMYTVYYHYNDKTEETEEKIEVVTGTGKVGDKIPYDTEKREYEGESYEFVSVSEKGKVIEENSEENVLHVYYVREEIEEPEEPEPEPEPEEPEPEEPEPEEPEPEEPEPEEPEPEEPKPDNFETPGPKNPPRTPYRPERPSKPDLPELPTIPVSVPVVIPSLPVTPPNTERVFSPPVLPAPSVPVKAEIAEVVESVETEVKTPVRVSIGAEEKIPLGRGRHKCCILHFFIMLVAFITEWLYRVNMKRHQKRIFELRREIEEIK